MKKTDQSLLPEEVIINKIYLIRGKKVMLDSDLAELYSVETKTLKQAVKRNIAIFPEHFMFELNKEEFRNLRSQIVTSSWGGRRYMPYVFTEYGILQLANILRSEKARKMSIRIIEIFVKMREILLSHKDILIKLEQAEKQLNRHNNEIQAIFNILKQLLSRPSKHRKKIGFRHYD